MTDYFTLDQLILISYCLFFITLLQTFFLFHFMDHTSKVNSFKVFQVLVWGVLFASTSYVSNVVATEKHAYNLKHYPLGVPGLKEVSLTYLKTEKTLYAEKKKLHFKLDNEEVVFEVETDTIAAMALSDKQPFTVYYYPQSSHRCLYKLTRDWTSIDTLLEGSKRSCDNF